MTDGLAARAPDAAPSPPMARKRIRLDPARPVASFIEAEPEAPDGAAVTRYRLGMLAGMTETSAGALVQSAERSGKNIALSRLVGLLEAAGYEVEIVAVPAEKSKK